MRFILAFGFVGLASMAVGCATESGSSDDLSSADQQGKGGTDNGTHLSVTDAVGTAQCLPDGNSLVAIEGVLTSTASAAWAEVTLTVDGVSSNIDEVLPTQW